MRNMLLGLLLTISGFAFGQITPENTYSYSGAYAKLQSSGYKFYLMDVGLAQCRIYNTNHTLWKTLNLSVPASNYLYDLKFLSEHLFTTDNTLCISYVYYSYDAVNAIYTFNAKVVKENGAELMTIPGCQYLEVVNLEGLGYKLVAYCYDYTVSPYTIQTKIYSLPGQLVSAESPNLPEKRNLPFPNPAVEHTTIPYSLPSGINSATIKVSDLQGRLIDQHIINCNADRITMPTAHYHSGLYNYSVEAGSQRFESGQFIVK
ncbi:MAG: T9SS type A sorting domain-containing protein [Lentimicrobium sp.]|nr:T9SS type A sorting domain-containing protein [Lentimicrobium sp.]